MNVLITGAGRGLGIGFVEYYLKQGHVVFACYRTVSLPLNSLRDKNTRLTLLQWDVTKTASSTLLRTIPVTLDLVINNAGIYGPGKDGQSFQNISPETMHEVFDVNTVAPLRVVQILYDRLCRPGAIIANISSKMGSSADNTSGGTYAYRAAKAALVIITKSMSMDMRAEGIRVISLHPGWVRTDMGGTSGLIGIEESVSGMARIIKNIDDYEPGAFVAYDGKIVPY